MRILTLIFLVPTLLYAQVHDSPNYNHNKFRQLEELLPTPNTYRTGSGAPGHAYWQNQADYVINVTLDDTQQKLTGNETITYKNNSPDALPYLWLQLDQNVRSKTSNTHLIEEGSIPEDANISWWYAKRLLDDPHDGGHNITAVTDKAGKALPFTVNQTMLRIDLPEPLQPGKVFEFNVSWWYYIQDQVRYGGRGGYEYFEENDNYLYEIAQWFPRMAVYDDVNGWQNKQFLGRGEFALPFGNYDVAITVPADHTVGATGMLQNAKEVLTAEQQARLAKAYENFEDPVKIVTDSEAVEIEKKPNGVPTATKTWRFKATKVRDFAWASSRKFIWDAMATKIGDRTVLAQSYYPKEGNPLWGKYSTRVVAHTLKSYSKYAIAYPYDQCTSVHGPVFGMEYPMLSFNGGRPNADGTYTARQKYSMISVIIHEVGHNWFPMIINSDERQWTWLDEGLNTFVQYLTEREWARLYPSRRGFPKDIAPYMRGDNGPRVPIMTNSESILQFGNNAYGKPATALNILRETVMGRELFDFAFKEYCRRWVFKHPQPADLFRTMEDASAVDLDWFFRGWFYTTDHVDMAIASVRHFQFSQGPAKDGAELGKRNAREMTHPTHIQNQTAIPKTYMERRPDLTDEYTNPDPYAPTKEQRARYLKYRAGLDSAQVAVLESNKHLYEITFENNGGLVMPVILQFTFQDGSTEEVRIPAELWRKSSDSVSKLFVFDKPLRSVFLDPHLETADTDLANNAYPPEISPQRLRVGE